MFRIIKENTVLGYAEKPVYVKNREGIWVDCVPTEAEAIAFNGTAYEGAKAMEVGSELYINSRVGEVEDGLCDLSAVCDDMANLEDALCELSMEEEEV